MVAASQEVVNPQVGVSPSERAAYFAGLLKAAGFSKLEVRDCGVGKGVGVFAKQSFEKGDVLLAEEPAGVFQHLRPQTSHAWRLQGANWCLTFTCLLVISYKQGWHHILRGAAKEGAPKIRSGCVGGALQATVCVCVCVCVCSTAMLLGVACDIGSLTSRRFSNSRSRCLS
eukprot:TRINITY_DN41948_c0_g1_i1.p1 TRINITY_DN41948_c0_g1~~TRINITY_DN41948_c0_g1_i1.p1  ORF type:complete len:171 (+),score=10.20 TRINITY_DN41948_c0_g1_i1:69-581(+)